MLNKRNQYEEEKSAERGRRTINTSASAAFVDSNDINRIR